MPSDSPSRLRSVIAANAELSMGLLEPLTGKADMAAEAITRAFLQDGKLITCGSAATAAISEYCAAIFADRLERERPGLPALALTSSHILNQSIASNLSQHEVHARQIRALAMENDCLLIFGPGADSAATVQAVSAAHDRTMQIIAITGLADSDLSALLTPDDIEIHIATDSLARLAEAQLLLSHCLCEAVEYLLFGLEAS